jgi:hypothetical protein
MNPLYPSLVNLQQRLSKAGIASAVIGGVAVSVWARPRATEDVDFKVLLERDAAQRLLDVLKPDYTALQSNPLQALQRNGVIFVRDQNGVRIDLQLADVDFDRSAIQRARSIELESGLSAHICTAEDLIIYKLISTRPLDQIDVENIVRRQADKLDDKYVLHWLRQFEQALDDSTLVKTYQSLRQNPAKASTPLA